jgi:hypothetical protein
VPVDQRRVGHRLGRGRAAGSQLYGEDAPPVTVNWPWPGDSATVTDAFGAVSRVPADDGRLRLRVSATPLFVEEQAAQDQAAQDQARQRNGTPPL